MIAGLITNGYLLTPKKIVALNEAELEHLQISIDNIEPDDVSKKSLKVLDKKLQYLAALADFAVNINSVIGGGIRNPEDAEVITRRAVDLGFASSLGIIHDGTGSVKPLNRREAPGEGVGSFQILYPRPARQPAAAAPPSPSGGGGSQTPKM